MKPTIKTAARNALKIFLGYFFFFSGIAYFRSLVIKHKKPLVRILLVHHIKYPNKLDRMLRFISTHYNPISFEDLIIRKFSRKQTNILFTMDDGYESWFTEGVALFKKYNISPVLFVSSGFIQSRENQSAGMFRKENLKIPFASEPLTKEMMESLGGITTIGGHTVSHPFLSQIDLGSIPVELGRDKTYLEATIKKPVIVFAYPFGDYNELVKKEVDKFYNYAMTTKSDYYNPEGDMLAMPRSNHGTVSNLVLRMWIVGAFDLAEKAVSQIMRLMRKNNLQSFNDDTGV